MWKHEMTGAKRRRELQKKGIMEYFSFPDKIHPREKINQNLFIQILHG